MYAWLFQQCFYLNRSRLILIWNFFLRKSYFWIAEQFRNGGCYGMDVCVSPLIHMLKPNPQRDNMWRWVCGRWLCLERWTNFLNGVSALMKENFLAPSAMWRHSKRMVILNQEASPHQTPNLLAPCSWTSQPPKLWEIMFVVWTTQPLAFCYSSPNLLRQWGNFPIAKN